MSIHSNANCRTIIIEVGSDGLCKFSATGGVQRLVSVEDLVPQLADYVEKFEDLNRGVPRRAEVGVSYKLKHFEKLLLRTHPALQFRRQGRIGALATEHLTMPELLSVPGIAESWWECGGSQGEVPQFTYAPFNKVPVEDFFDVTDDGTGSWIGNPKGFPDTEE